MKKIYKYKLPVNGGIITIDDCIVEILDLQAQDGIPTMWAVVHDDSKMVNPIEIVAIGTGWTVPTGVDKYLGTVQDGLGYVWHYFSIEVEELRDKPEEKSYMQMKEEALAVLAQSLGKVGTTAEEASKAFDMRGLFDACM